MTTSARPIRRPSGRVLAVGLLGLASGIAAGAWLDWFLWHPMSSIVPTMGFALLLLAGGLAFLIRAPRIRAAAIVLLAFAVGGFAGQAAGPRRPDILRTETGSIELALANGAAATDSGASCGLDRTGSQIVVDPGEFGISRPNETADFHYVDVAIGDMWDFGDRHARPDHVTIRIRAIKPLVAEDGKPGEVIHETDASSIVNVHSVAVSGGSIEFANLVIDSGPGTGSRSDLAGTVSWTCGPMVATAG